MLGPGLGHALVTVLVCRRRHRGARQCCRGHSSGISAPAGLMEAWIEDARYHDVDAVIITDAVMNGWSLPVIAQ